MCINLSQLSVFAHLNLFVYFPCYQVAYGNAWMNWTENTNEKGTQDKVCTSQRRLASMSNMCVCLTSALLRITAIKRTIKFYILCNIFWIFDYCQQEE